MREIVFDTETTGLDPSGDRIIEIGCVELINHIPTGQVFHAYINPGRPVSVDAVDVHGLDDAFLSDKPAFAEIADDLLRFLGDAILIAHNASFDLSFMNMELGRVGRPAIPEARVIDTLALARRKHPMAPNSLDALCARYAVDASRRTYHGARLDAELLCEVYIELIGGRQAALLLGEEPGSETIAVTAQSVVVAVRSEPRTFTVTAEELAAHQAAVEELGDGAIWLRYARTVEPSAAAAG